MTNYKIILAAKLYFKKYTHKLTIKLIEPPHIIVEYKIKADKIKINLGLTKQTQKILNYISKIVPDNRTRAKTINNQYQLDIFLSDEKALDKLLKKYCNRIVELTKPISEKHIMALKNERIIIKSHLFWHKFRYKIVLKWSEYSLLSRHEIQELRNLCISTEGKCRYNLQIYSRTIYLEQEEDLILFKLTYSEIIDRLITIKTYDELK